MGTCINIVTRHLIITLTSVLFFSCASNRVVGLYGKCSKHYFACSQYLFKNNKEFEYFNFMDVGGASIVKGVWKQAHDTIILNSSIQPSDRITEIIESKIDTSSNLTFEFYNESSKGKDAAFVRLNSDTSKAYLITNDDSIKMPKTTLTKLFLSPFFDSQAFPIPYTIKNSGSNHFLVKTKNLDQSNFIINEKFLVIRKKICRLDSNGNLHKNIFYKKVRLSKKQF